MLRLATSLISDSLKCFCILGQVMELGEAVDTLEKEEALGCEDLSFITHSLVTV